MSHKWTREDLMELFEELVDRKAPVFNNPYFRKLLSRDQNLYINQTVRGATNTVAYRKVDFDIDEVDDKGFWERIDSTEYNELLEDNAARDILKMAERFNLIN